MALISVKEVGAGCALLPNDLTELATCDSLLVDGPMLQLRTARATSGSACRRTTFRPRPAKSPWTGTVQPWSAVRIATITSR